MSMKKLTILSLALLAMLSAAAPAGAVTYYWSGTNASYDPVFDTAANSLNKWWDTYIPTTYSGANPTSAAQVLGAAKLVIPLDDRRAKFIQSAGGTVNVPPVIVGNTPSGAFDVAWLSTPELSIQDGTSGTIYNWSNLILHRGLARNYAQSKTWAGKVTIDGTFNFVPRAATFTVSAEVDATGASNIYVMPYLYKYTGGVQGNNSFAWQPSACWFYGTWIIRDRIQAKSSGAMGEADIQLHSVLPTAGDGVTTYMTPGGSPSYTVYADCPGVIDVSVSDAISSNAVLYMNTAYYGTVTTPQISQVVTNVPVTVRAAQMNGVDIPAGTYYSTSATVNINGTNYAWISGTGSVTVRDTLGAPTLTMRNLTMACGDPNSKTYPLINSTKAYAAGNIVKIKAVNDATSPWAFSYWSSSTGSGIASPTSMETTITIPTASDITVTAHYIAAAGSPVPATGATSVSAFTNLGWTPVSSGVTSQDVYFGTDNPPATRVATGGSSMNSVANSLLNLGSPLADTTTYYWMVKTNGNAGALWSFTTGNATPNTPSPANAAVEQAVDNTLSWTADSAATSFDVYFSTDQALVTAGDPSVKTPSLSSPMTVTGLTRGAYYYWKVVAHYPGATRTSPVWSFRTLTYKLTLKVDTLPPTYSLDGAADVNGVLDDANTAVFKFASFNLNNQWDIVVSGTARKGVAIWSDSDITFGGLIDVSATRAIPYGANGVPKAGGYLAQAKLSNIGGDTAPQPDKAISGPGTSTHKVGGNGYPGSGGAGYGGAGGNYGYVQTEGTPGLGGPSYGEQELYTLWGGSGAAGGLDNTGGSGGGIVEFYAKGNITLASTAALKSNGAAGGDSGATRCGPGGGSGGSVRLVATGNVSVAGTVTANGGDGCTAGTGNQGGGGGGGGRIAVYHGGAYTQTGTVTAAGGIRGNAATSTAATDGGAGTVYTAGNPTTLMTAHNMYPANNAVGVPVSDPAYAYVAFNPALGSTSATLYFGTSSGSMSAVASYSDANGLRARRVYRPALAMATQYYWRVDINGVQGSLMTFRSAGQEAHSPSPVSGTTGVDVHNPRLSWQMYSTAGTKWEVYFGTNSANLGTVKKTITDPNALGMFYDAGELLANKTYYWRVDETNTFNGSPRTWTGYIWNFTTRAAICPAAGKPAADLNDDCKVNFLDMAIFASQWKVCKLYPVTDCN